MNGKPGKYTAFGKTLTLAEWIKQPECTVKNIKTLWSRIHTKGWPLNLALTLPPLTHFTSYYRKNKEFVDACY